jgi:hypothetical protein
LLRVRLPRFCRNSCELIFRCLFPITGNSEAEQTEACFRVARNPRAATPIVGCGWNENLNRNGLCSGFGHPRRT